MVAEAYGCRGRRWGRRTDISPAVAGRVQAGAILSLTVIHVLVQIADFGFGRDHLLGLTPLFDLNQENNIPTCYSGIVLFTMCGGVGNRRRGELSSRRPVRPALGGARDDLRLHVARRADANP